MLTINQVAWQQSNTPILEDISCDIAQGKLYALIGQNGSGKSSLIKLMAGEILPHTAISLLMISLYDN